MRQFVPWDSQPLNTWAKKYAVGRFLDLGGRSTHYVDVPILVVWGRHDKAIPLQWGEEMHRLLKGSRMEIFEQMGHCPHDERPEPFNRLALDFLSSTMNAA